MDWYKNLMETGSGIWWAICSSDGTAFYGACGFNNLSAIHKKAELGFWLLPKYWGKGIVAEAVKEIMVYAFERLGLHRVEAYVETENENSKRALEKLGFQKEGVMRDVEMKNGRFISLAIYARLEK